VSLSGEYIYLDTTVAGGFGRNSLEILMLFGSPVRPVTFVYLPLIIRVFMGVPLSLVPIRFN
jgi:hypothetical protein